MHRIEDRSFRPSFFVKVPPAELPDLQRRLEILDQVAATRVVMRRTGLAAEAPEPLLEIVPRHYADLRDAARIVDSAGRYYEYALFDVDVRFSQRYFLQHGIFPMGLVAYDGSWRPLEEHFALEYELPDLRRDVLDVRIDAPAGIPRIDDRLLAASLGGDLVDGTEEDILRGINALVEDRDPDIVFTDGGDAFLMPYLEKKAKANGVDLRLGRDPGFHGTRSAKSYFTYGKIVYKPSQYLLKGRLHLDRGHFAVRESGFAGLVELSRLSTLPPQEQARLTPGTAITAMQTNLAHEDGVAVLWKKNMPELFKTAEDLVLGDRGGFIFEPQVGLHEGIVEIDYASLYPNIMVKFNISQETLDCTCCLMNGRVVPGLKYHLCTRRLGLIPRVLRPLIERKRYYKRMKKESTPQKEIYEGRDTILKWTLVTCLDGKTMIPHRRDGIYSVKPIKEIIDPILSHEGVVSPTTDLHVFSIDENSRVVEKGIRKVLKLPAPPKMLSIKFSRGRGVTVTPNHRFYALTESGLDIVTAANLRKGQWIPIGQVLPLGNEPVRSINLIEGLLAAGLPWVEEQLWRCRGEILKDAIRRNYRAVLTEARSLGYTHRTIWLWRDRGLIPLRFVRLLGLTKSELDALSIGFTRRRGGAITFLPARMEIDDELAFLLGFYIADGSGTGNMLRLYIGLDEPEIVGKLMNCVREKFGLIGQVREEGHTRMFTVQFNSVALTRFLHQVLRIGKSSEYGKLIVPDAVLNGTEDVRYSFFAGLLAGDGYISPERDWAYLATSNLPFAFAVGSLLSTLGIDYNIRTAKSRQFHLYSVDVKLSALEGKIWWKRKHLERLKLKTATSFRNHREIPIRASGFFDLATRYHRSHSLSRNYRATMSRTEMKRELVVVRNRVETSDEFAIGELEKLADGELTFVEIVDIEEISPEEKWVYCFEVEKAPNAFLCNGNLVVGNCFGYQGYKNARYGRIECHEAINAYARDLLLDSMRLAEQHGFEVVHGIVDSLWLRPTAKAGDVRKLLERINADLGFPIDLEGTYRWIVFLPCKTTGVGALNRYYGLFETGEFKLRGIELRKHDTPGVVNKVEELILKELARAKTAQEFTATIPRCVDLIRGTAKTLRENRVPLGDLVLTKTVSRKLDEYLVMNATVAALRQLEKRGFAVEPGEYVRYVILDESAKEAEAKVRPAQFLTGTEAPDAQAYVRLICRAGETLFAPFGWTEERLLAACRRVRDAPDVDLRAEPELGGFGAREGHYPGTGIGYHTSYAADGELIAEE